MQMIFLLKLDTTDNTKIEFKLDYQPDGKKETITDNRGTTTLKYNIAGDLTKVVQPELEGSEILYTYDPRGNNSISICSKNIRRN